MADDQFQMGSGNWWETSRNRYDGGTTPTSISTTLNSIATFGWPTEMVDMKPRSSMDPATPSDAASMVLQSGGGGAHDHQSSASAGGGGGVLDSPNLQLMGFGLSSHSMDWNQALFRGEKAENSFRSLLQEDLSSNSSGFQQESGPAGSSSQEHWRQKLSDENEFKQINRGFSLDQPQFNSQASSNDSSITSQNLNTGFQADSAAAYGFLLSENRPMNYPYPSSGYGANVGELIPSWNKYQQFLRTSPPPPPASSGHLHFTNHTSFWNASATPATDARSSFFPALQTQINPPASSFDEKPKNPREVQDLGATTKKNNTETSIKRPRNETPPPNLPAFKVRKEKMGDRITALQQLVSPFGKTDTASVLSEAIEYIKFLHGQVSALSTPYMKNGAPTQQHHQDSDISKDPEGPRHDLRSRGLCLVPVSSTFPMTHETAVDFWSPTFGGTFR